MITLVFCVKLSGPLLVGVAGILFSRPQTTPDTSTDPNHKIFVWTLRIDNPVVY